MVALENQAVGNVERLIDEETSRRLKDQCARFPILTKTPGNTPLHPDDAAQLTPNLATRKEVDEWERTKVRLSDGSLRGRTLSEAVGQRAYTRST
jgi:hypothetical protein